MTRPQHDSLSPEVRARYAAKYLLLTKRPISDAELDLALAELDRQTLGR